MELDYFVVDVFTDEALKGNALAVVLNTVNLTTEQMLKIAREFNLSETTFIERRPPEIERTEGVRVRIFTTQEELPFAGHPTLGTASVLKLHAPEVIHENTVTLALKVGPVPVRFTEEGLFGEMTQRDPEFGLELDRREVVRLIGLEEDDLNADHAPQVVSTGTAFAIAVLRSAEALARLKVSHEESTAWLRERGARWFYVLGPENNEAKQWRARMQFNGGEDAATGSAAGCAISYLVGRGIVHSNDRIRVRQGVEIARESHLFLSAKLDDANVTNVRVGGSTVPVANGRLFLA
jgi:trans-2,3-dihydro-3-hydroxyanthranilate isomerase